jgi:hypothetical protein
MAGFGRGGGAPGNSGTKGQFQTLAALQLAFPAGQDGWSAWVGPRLYRWNPVSAVWEDSGITETSLTLETLDAVSAGQPLYVTAAGKFRLAQADAAGTAEVMGLARAAAAANVGVTITTENFVLADWTAVIGTVALAPGQTYYLSAATAGRLTTTAPSAAGHRIVRVGRSLDTQTMAVDPASPYLIS